MINENDDMFYRWLDVATQKEVEEYSSTPFYGDPVEERKWLLASFDRMQNAEVINNDQLAAQWRELVAENHKIEVILQEGFEYMSKVLTRDLIVDSVEETNFLTSSINFIQSVLDDRIEDAEGNYVE